MTKRTKQSEQRLRDATLGRKVVWLMWAIRNYETPTAGNEEQLANNVGRLARQILEEVLFEEDETE